MYKIQREEKPQGLQAKKGNNLEGQGELNWHKTFQNKYPDYLLTTESTGKE